MERLLEGIRKFQKNVFPAEREIHEKLAREGQAPHALAIVCADSRVKFTTLVQSQHGEVFVIRNAGNIVPPYEAEDIGVTASIEYAVINLPIRDIVVCGHTHCGAVTALLHPESAEGLPAVKSWLRYSKQARERVEDKHPDSDGAQKLRWAIGENVLLQVENLKGYPCVKERLEQGKVRVHAWVFEIETGKVWTWNYGTERWDVIG